MDRRNTTYVDKLMASLDSMKIPYVVGPPQHKYTKAKDEGILSGVGIVFDAEGPADLIRRIQHEYFATTNQALEYATTQDTVMEFSSPPANMSSFGVRLGVYFPDIFKVYPVVKTSEWVNICKNPDQQRFDSAFKKWAEGFKSLAENGRG